MGPYDILNTRSLNPLGRTGISGRGYFGKKKKQYIKSKFFYIQSFFLLFVKGKWGPNHTADPVVTRYFLK